MLPNSKANSSIVEIIRSFEQIKFHKSTIVVHQGDPMTQLYYIEKGIVRGYYLDEDGREVTKCFSAEGDLFGVEGFLYQREASYSIDCLEDVVCEKISYEQVREWMVQDVSNPVTLNGMIIDALRIMEERARSLLLSDARERYESFLTDYGRIAGRLTQKCIASYLGINEASLCRLKKKIDLGQCE